MNGYLTFQRLSLHFYNLMLSVCCANLNFLLGRSSARDWFISCWADAEAPSLSTAGGAGPVGGRTCAWIQLSWWLLGNLAGQPSRRRSIWFGEPELDSCRAEAPSPSAAAGVGPIAGCACAWIQLSWWLLGNPAGRLSRRRSIW
jgi:hypothetical protein